MLTRGGPGGSITISVEDLAVCKCQEAQLNLAELRNNLCSVT